VPFDPLFKRHGAGTYLPVNIQGSTDHPKIQLDWKKVPNIMRAPPDTSRERRCANVKISPSWLLSSC
jgi:hypothetical protein